MTTTTLPSSLSGKDVAKRIFFLAYQASQVFGMGMLQARPNVTEENVWDNVNTAGDYPCDLSNEKSPTQVTLRADYVFGRMMKLDVTYTDKTITLSDSPPRPDYQSWCRTYHTTEALLVEAIKSLTPVIK